MTNMTPSASQIITAAHLANALDVVFPSCSSDFTAEKFDEFIISAWEELDNEEDARYEEENDFLDFLADLGNEHY